MKTARVAAVTWTLHPVKSDGEFFGRWHDLISASHEKDAEVIVFPEGHSYELLCLAPDLKQCDYARFLHQYAEQIETWMLRIAASSGITIVGGSYLKMADDGPRTICPIASPDGTLTLVEKNRLSEFEADVLDIGKGRGLAKPPGQWLGAALSRDAEFPEAVRALVESGVLVLTVPAWSADSRSFQRLRRCCAARAEENEIFVIHAALNGSLPHLGAFGSAAILAPSLPGFPESGVLAGESAAGESLIFADLNLDAIVDAHKGIGGKAFLDRHPLHWDVIG